MQSPANNNINEYDFSALEEIQPKEFNLGDSLRELFFYLLPVAGFVLFLSLLFFAVIPNIQDMNTKLAEIEQLKADDAKLKDRIVNIKALGLKNDEIDTMIKKINTIVPSGDTSVVQFGNRISALAAAQGLTNNSLKTGETVMVLNQTSANNGTGQQTITTNPVTDLPLSQIPTQFDVLGGYNNIRNFFKELYKGNDFFVVDKMVLNGNAGESWFGEISLVKYQFTPNKAFDPTQAYGKLTEEAVVNPDVVQFLKQKFISNAFEVGTVTPTPTPTPVTVKP